MRDKGNHCWSIGVLGPGCRLRLPYMIGMIGCWENVNAGIGLVDMGMVGGG